MANSGRKKVTEVHKVGDKITYHNIKSKRKKTGTIKAVKKAGKDTKYELSNGQFVYHSDLTEGVLDATDDSGFVVKRHLYDIAKYAVELHKMIQDTDYLNAEVIEKIARASLDIDQIKHNLEYELAMKAADTAAMADMPVAEPVEGPFEYATEDDLVEYGDPDGGSAATAEDIIRWANLWDVITRAGKTDPEVHRVAQELADEFNHVKHVEVTSEDRDIMMMHLVDKLQMQGLGHLLHSGAARFESVANAKAILERIMKPIKGRKGARK